MFATNVLGDGPPSPPVLIEFSKLLLGIKAINIHAYIITDNHNESASGVLANIALYSIVGGSSIVILSLMLAIIMLAGFLRKVYRSFQT